MSPQDMQALAIAIAPLVAEQVVEKLRLSSASPAQTAAAPTFRHRLNVEQFAYCVERSEEVVRRKIRGRVIPANLVEGPPYLIHPKALEIFGVTEEIAAIRLTLLAQSKQPTQPPVAADQLKAA